MQPPSGSVPTLPIPPFLTSVSPTSTVHGIKANWADFFWFIFWLQASLHHQLLNVLISLFKLSQAAQAKQKNACLLAGDCQAFASPVYYIVRWSKSMLYDSKGFVIFGDSVTSSYGWVGHDGIPTLILISWQTRHVETTSVYGFRLMEEFLYATLWNGLIYLCRRSKNSRTSDKSSNSTKNSWRKETRS